MTLKNLQPAAAAGALAILAGAAISTCAEQPPNFFNVADANQDGFVTRDEFRAATAKWLSGGSGGATEQQLTAALDPLFPDSLLNAMLAPLGPQNQTPKDADVA